MIVGNPVFHSRNSASMHYFQSEVFAITAKIIMYKIHLHVCLFIQQLVRDAPVFRCLEAKGKHFEHKLPNCV